MRIFDRKIGGRKMGIGVLQKGAKDEENGGNGICSD
jgi:hypothetical protein